MLTVRVLGGRQHCNEMSMLGGGSKKYGLIVSSRYGRTARDVDVKVEKAGYTVGDRWFDCIF